MSTQAKTLSASAASAAAAGDETIAQAVSQGITMVIPTRNRAHTLRLVAPSWYEQEGVRQIIFVSDEGTDETPLLVHGLASRYPHVHTLLLRNTQRLGASRSRNVGVEHADHEFVLFCDDDEYLQAGYARTCLDKLLALRAGAVSGRRVYMQSGETREQALARFGSGMRRGAAFRPLLCEYVNGAIFRGDLEMPFTNAIILTRRSLLQRYPFDGYYARGNGYREETDYQMNLFVNGHRIFVTNEVHSLHLPLNEVRTGGQRTQAFKRMYWSIHYTRYFFGKYWTAYARRQGLRTPRWAALAAFAAFAVYRETLRPPAYQLAMWGLGLRARLRTQASLG